MTDYKVFIERLRESIPDLEIRSGEPMKNHTSFKIGGPAAVLALPKSAKQIEQICKIAEDMGVKLFVMGNGTNLLVSDEAIDIFIVKTHDGAGNAIVEGEDRIVAESGALLSKVAVLAQKSGLTGLEFAHGIPGTIGGAVMMNAGAYGGEIKDVIESVTAYCPGKGVITLKNEDCMFGYRHSVFEDMNGVVLSAVLKLEKGDPDAIKGKMDELSAKRRASQPLNMPSAGSTFKRPVGGYAAALIQDAGLKGKGIGGACVSEKHAGFIVNKGGATFDDVIQTMEMVRDEVYKTSGIELTPEVRIIK